MTTKLGSDLVIGDALNILGRAYVIVSFEATRPFLGGELGRTACICNGNWRVATIRDSAVYTPSIAGTWAMENAFQIA